VTQASFSIKSICLIKGLQEVMSCLD